MFPTDYTSEHVISSIGSEEHPQNVTAKGTLWGIQANYGDLLVREYTDTYSPSGYFKISDLDPDRFLLTPALNSNKTLNSSRFWVWIINSNNNLTLYEMEPFTSSSPIITKIKNITTNVSQLSTYVRAGEVIRLLALYSTSSLTALKYDNIDSISYTTTNLAWDSSRQNNFSNFIDSSNLQLDLAFTQPGSPPDVYTDSYTVPTPLNLTVAQVGVTPFVDSTWGTSLGSDQYTLERDTTSSFNSLDATNAYVGPLTHPPYDPIPTSGTYYYRVKAQVTSLLLQ